MWLWYVGVRGEKRPRSNIDLGDGVDFDLPTNLVLESPNADCVPDSGVVGNGGDFGGGGATDSWGAAEPMQAHSYGSPAGSSVGGSGKSSGSGFDFDFGDEVIIIIALALLLVVIFGAGAYLVYAAPEILSEAAFEALLAAGLIKASRNISRQGWMGSVFKATVLPFIVVLLMTGIFGLDRSKTFPTGNSPVRSLQKACLRKTLGFWLDGDTDSVLHYFADLSETIQFIFRSP
jgi:hypothetical protein